MSESNEEMHSERTPDKHKTYRCPGSIRKDGVSVEGDADSGVVTGDQVIEFAFTETISFDYYSCEEAIKRLNEFLDQELNAQDCAVVSKHLQVCKPCLERFDFEKNLLVQLRIRAKTVCAPSALKEKLSGLLKSMSF